MKRRGPEDPPDEDCPLFSMPPHNQRATSVAAAFRMLPKAGSQRRKVYDCIASAGEHGRTREEIYDILGLPSKSVDPRVWELLGNPRKDGRAPLIFVASVTKMRKTASGNMAEVLVAF